MDGAKILVTSDADFIWLNGSNALAESKDEVALNDCYFGDPRNLSEVVTFVEDSVLDDDLPTDVDVVIHLAALSSYTMQEGNASRSGRVNVEAFVNVVEQARNDDCDIVVYASNHRLREPDGAFLGNHGRDRKHGLRRLETCPQPLCGVLFGPLRPLDVWPALFSIYQGYGGAEGHKDEYANAIAQFADDIAHGRSPESYGDGE